MKYPWPLSVKSAKIYFHVLSLKQKDDHTFYIIKYSLTESETKNLNRGMEQKAEELYENCWGTSQTTVFSR